MLERWAQVLADGEDVHIMFVHVMHDFKNLVPGLAKSQHEAGLGGSGGIHLFGPFQDLQRAFVDSLRAHAPVQAWHRLDVVVEDVGPRIDHRLQGFVDAFEIGRQHFNAALRIEAANPANGRGKDGRAAIFKFIAVDRCDDGVTQTHFLHSFSNPLWFLPVKANGATGLYGAKTATARTNAAQDHKGRGFVAPAFADIGAARLLAYRVQLFAAHQL